MALCGDPNCRTCYPNGAFVEDEVEVRRTVTPLPAPSSGGGGGGSSSSGGDDAIGLIAMIFVVLVVLGIGYEMLKSAKTTKPTEPAPQRFR